MSTVLDERVVLEAREADEGITHWVCHCTNDNIAACGLDVTESEMLDSWAEEDDCPLCILVWGDAPRCPWGCSCPGECGW